MALPARHAGGHPVKRKAVKAPHGRPGFRGVTGTSGRQWTSHCRSSRHLCPVVVLDILSRVFIPPLSFDPSTLPCSLPYDIITQRYPRASKQHQAGRSIRLSVRLKGL